MTHLYLVFLQLDLTEDTVALVAAHGPQFLFVEGEQLGSSEDPQTVNSPAGRQRRNHLHFYIQHPLQHVYMLTQSP